MHFLIGVLLTLAILWILTCTKFGRIVLFASFVLLVLAVFGGIALRDHQHAQQAAAQQSAAQILVENAKRCVERFSYDPSDDADVIEGQRIYYRLTHPGCSTY